MTRKVSTVAGKKYAYYLCSTNKETKRCYSHRIPEKDLEDAVLVMLKQHIQNILHIQQFRNRYTCFWSGEVRVSMPRSL